MACKLILGAVAGLIFGMAYRASHWLLSIYSRIYEKEFATMKNNNYRVNHNIAIENAHIIWRNFSGKPSQFNNEGKRNFCVVLDPEMAQKLADEGWNVKSREPREEGDDPLYYMQVSVSYDNIPPTILTITSYGKSRLNSDTVDILDWAEIENVDLVISPYNWEVNGKHGVKAYVKNMYVTLVEDEFAEKYADVPDSNR